MFTPATSASFVSFTIIESYPQPPPLLTPTDLLFMIALIVYLGKLQNHPITEPISYTIGWCVGMGWGVVIIVFTGAILLLLDKGEGGHE